MIELLYTRFKNIFPLLAKKQKQSERLFGYIFQTGLGLQNRSKTCNVLKKNCKKIKCSR